MQPCAARVRSRGLQICATFFSAYLNSDKALPSAEEGRGLEGTPEGEDEDTNFEQTASGEVEVHFKVPASQTGPLSRRFTFQQQGASLCARLDGALLSSGDEEDYRCLGSCGYTSFEDLMARKCFVKCGCLQVRLNFRSRSLAVRRRNSFYWGALLRLVSSGSNRRSLLSQVSRRHAGCHAGSNERRLSGRGKKETTKKTRVARGLLVYSLAATCKTETNLLH